MSIVGNDLDFTLDVKRFRRDKFIRYLKGCSLSIHAAIITHPQLTPRTSTMKTSASIALLNLALLTANAAEQKDIQIPCNEAWGAIGCTRNIQYPSLIKKTYGG